MKVDTQALVIWLLLLAVGAWVAWTGYMHLGELLARLTLLEQTLGPVFGP